MAPFAIDHHWPVIAIGSNGANGDVVLHCALARRPSLITIGANGSPLTPSVILYGYIKYTNTARSYTMCHIQILVYF